MNNIVNLRNLKNEENREGAVMAPKGEFNPQRRELLKFLLVGIAAFVLGALVRHLTPTREVSKCFKDLENKDLQADKKIETNQIEINKEKETEIDKELDFGDWRVEKKNNETIFYDKKTNEEVLILD